MSVVFATEAKVGSSTFEVPEGYTSHEFGCVNVFDGKSAIIMKENPTNLSTSKQELINKGYVLTGYKYL